MQETQYATRLAVQDNRWMLGDADLGSVLAPFSASLAAPEREAPSPQSTLSSALVTVSVDLNALTLEQVRLRETLETLNTTLFITGAAVTAPALSPATSETKKTPEETKPAETSATQLLKWAVEGLTDSFRTKVSDKVLEATLGKIPGIGAVFQGAGKGGDACCSGVSEALRGPKRYGPNKSSGKRGPGKPTFMKSRRSPPRTSLSFVATVRSLFEKVSKVFEGPRLGFNASTIAPRAAAPSSLAGAAIRLESSVVRRLGPLKYVDSAMAVVQGVRQGDAKAVGSGLSTAGGAWAGASAGAALGTLVFPGIGTAVGGAIGGLLGSEAGSWLGDKLFSSSDRLPAPNALSKELNSARTDNVQVTISPSIQITGVNPADAQQVVNQVLQALQFQCMPMVTDSLGIRRNAALADPGGD
ncbi:hypothetical protein [Pseudomonas sp. efr-133-TYG-23]|uniref:hypothetical protein n=1 Tax=Pseudomonas sp. efr-133-TYG-23 TaxID=3040309 RepID=UPI0025551960|nr:hypothetical protein [Pseudomonas sp. efr-133-TYG-23]